MFRRLLCSLLLAGVVFSPTLCLAQQTRSGLISPITARRYGLKRSWYTRIEMDRAQSRIAYVTMHVNKTDFFLVQEVVYEGGKQAFTERDLDRFGDKIGIAGARELATARMKELKEKGVEAKIVLKEIPSVTLYVQTDRGTLQALDGETGRTIWTAQIGVPEHPTLAPGASNTHVAVVNGSNLFVLNAGDGTLLWEKRLGHAPGAGPAVNEHRVFVPLVNGRIEAYGLKKHRKSPWIYQSAGRAMIQPTVTPNTVSWATDRGIFYVAYANRDIVRYRRQARDTIVSPSTYAAPHRLFFASIDGDVRAMHEYTGDTHWRFPTGEPISHAPVVVNGGVYVVTDRAGMFRVSVETGSEDWWTPQVDQFAAASENRVYAFSDAGRLLIIDAATGGRIGAMPTEGLDLKLTNWQTDRIYLGNKFGAIQCLHEEQLDWPILHVAEEQKPGVRPPVREVAAGDGGDEEPVGDPFGDGDAGDGDAGDGDAGDGEDPFGGGDAGDGDAGDGDDPFGGGDAGGGDDPFGGGDAGGGDAGGGGGDPFGGGDAGGGGGDPFGGGDAGGGDDPFG